MRNPLHLLILLGFICQGLSWNDDYLLPAIYGALWLGSVLLGQHRAVVISTLGEAALLALGCAGGYYGARAMDASSHFFIGHGLVLVQASRLLRAKQLSRRETVYSLLIAIFHLGVGATFIFDYRFVPIFLCAAVLLPCSLMRLEADSFPAAGADVRGLRLGAGAHFWALVLSLVFFLVLPRGLVPGGLPFQRPGPRDRGSLNDAVMDPTRGGLPQSSQVVLQIEGEEIGYLRSFALERFDGVLWMDSGRGEQLRAFTYVPPDRLVERSRRRVRVKNVAFLGRRLPADGHLLKVEGKFFSQPYASSFGSIRCENIWSTANNYYEYWIDSSPPPDPITERQRSRLLDLPKEPSPELRAWLGNVLKDVPNDPYAQARQLENHFRRKFTYQLGAPALNRLNPVEDFILNQREGHCERFASALAVALRIKGIPSRVMIGYYPSSRNWMSGWVNVRFKDAHAWTQGFIEGRGWVDFDGTPAALTPPADPPLAELLDTADFVWNAFVVNFDAAVQHRLLAVGAEFVLGLPEALNEHPLLVVLLGLAILLKFYWKQVHAALAAWRSPRRIKQKSLLFAEHHYGRMLRALARRGLHRPAQQTPLEFLAELRRAVFPVLSDVEKITSIFCVTRYGGQVLTEEDQRAAEQALRRIEQWRPAA